VYVKIHGESEKPHVAKQLESDPYLDDSNKHDIKWFSYGEDETKEGSSCISALMDLTEDEENEPAT